MGTSVVSIGIVTVSDRASRGVYQDRGGPAVVSWLSHALTTPWEPVIVLIPDEKPIIEQTLVELCDVKRCCLVLTTGGTGPGLRDVTPEATESVCEKLMVGFGERMRQATYGKTPISILSRQLAGIRGQSLIINLPGNPKAIGECLESVFSVVPACIEHINGPLLETDESVIPNARYWMSAPEPHAGEKPMEKGTVIK